MKTGNNPMMPSTIHGLRPMQCVSAMQKAIRRSDAAQAMALASELLHTSKAFHTMTCNRLEIIVHEDIDTLARPELVAFVHAACEQSRDRYKQDAPGEARLIIGNVIRVLSAAPKSRAGCHFAAAIGLANAIEGKIPTIPDYAIDVHTREGKRKGRGLKHFREEGALLIPAPTEPDAYEAEAYRLWAFKYGEAAAGDDDAQQDLLP